MAIHFVVIDQHFSDLIDGPNDERGVTSPSMLLSALAAPFATFNGQDLHPDILTKAAVLMRSLIKDHHFYNGNKRTAVMAVILFLEDNGYDLRVEDRKLIKLAKEIATHNISIHRIRKWLIKYTKKVKVSAKDSVRYTYGGSVVRWFRDKIRDVLSDFYSSG